jgi:hypothetical protein
MNQFPPSPTVSYSDGLKFFQKFAEKFASQRHRWQFTTGLNDTGGKFATGVNGTGGK